MSAFSSIDLSTANTAAKAALETTRSDFGGIPNLMKMLANAPNVLNGILAFNREVTSGEIDPKLIEQVALLTSALNQCEYCVAVHVHVGQQAGLNRSELIANLQGTASDRKSQAVLDFTREIVANRGKVDPQILSSLRERGLSDRAILEILGVIGVYTFLNYAKHLTQPTLDFPAVPEFQPGLEI